MAQRGRNSQGSKDRSLPSLSNEEVRRRLEAADKLYFRIGEVSRLTGVKAHVLRYWETEFRWMAPPKSRSKQRLYRKRDIEFVLLLKRLLWDERYTIAGARQRIQELGVEEAMALLDQPLTPGATQAMPTPAPDDEPEMPRPRGLRATLDDMHAELLAVKSLLQESL